MENDKYRHEFKYQINAMQVELLKSRLDSIMELDGNAREAGGYQIRSLYFDDYDNSCYYANENGTDPREKFRIRIYNGESTNINLELKRKESGKTLKRSCRLTEEQCHRMMEGKGLEWEETMPPLLKKFYLWQETQLLRPKVIVEYDRVPYVCPDGNVRVTLDLDMRSSAQTEDFLDREIAARPIMPAGEHLLEVKYDEFLPDYIYRTIQMKKLQQTTYSKYYLCRKFTV